ncbi:nuclear transport factor 2 family protein [Microbacterium fluvii]|uniref:Nuclear transport factor 2 family protein n=1 Tax=Microbacterium fluvii TaxID=415215 RepID=A0ABW2HG40_9MICO|nr:nuclear transport factor 2 family protein [Microbacterium fluvii]MCU4673188.1 nuclear transport factor 2 family protein [Microbacterium fluvii]
MQEARFREYIRRFNEEDDTAFDDYLAPDMHMKNGTLEFDGVDGMKHHYRDLIWPHFVERLTVPRFVSDDGRAAIQMNTVFTAKHDADDTLFGAVKKGETFQFDGVIMYEIDDTDRFADILVAYNSFVYTDLEGNSRDLGIPH